MLQVIQSLANGSVEAANVPAPLNGNKSLLIETKVSLLSGGTERMLLEFGRGNLLQKALSQPARVRQVIAKVKTDGLCETIEAVRSKLDQPIPLGYCNAGQVLEVGAGVSGFRVGDRVVSNGPHAELVARPWTLCARIPDGVTDETAAFTPLAAIGLQGVRLAAPTLGESVVVIGLGLVGQLTSQILKANGCRVLGIDVDAGRVSLCRAFGIEALDISAGQDPVAGVLDFTRGQGADAVIISASSKGNDLVSQAARMSRKRGRIVLVGVTGLELDRAEFYEKELTFQVSCSYGPGRYDPEYEELGRDYPLGFVRWTEQRNFEAVLDLMASGALKVEPLVTHRFDIDRAIEAYQTLTDDRAAVGIVFNYPRATEPKTVRAVSVATEPEYEPGPAAISVIGAGNFAARVLIPAFKLAGADLRMVVSQGGVSALVHARRNGFQRAGSDPQAVFADSTTTAVVIATRHESHAELAIRALDSDKSVFVEKPLALTEADLDKIVHARQAALARSQSPLVMVGFNRRFAPLSRRMKLMLDQIAEPMTFVTVMNAGAIPADHWTQNPEIGGGRIIGEACHHIDLLRFLAGSPIIAARAVRVGRPTADGLTDDKATIVLSFANGSHGTVHYFANGSSAFPKERIEAFGGGRILQLDNFRKLEGWGWEGFGKIGGRQDKGHNACAAAYLRALSDGLPSPIPFEELIEVARWSIRAAAFDA